MMHTDTKNVSIRKEGFTLIETLVAILILIVAVTGPLTIASRGLNAALIAKDQTIAFYLAQDAVEYVRSVRDSNSIKGDNWLTGALGTGSTAPGTDLSVCEPANSANGCTVDVFHTPAIAQCGNSPCTQLYYNKTNFQYSQQSSGNTKSPFTRSFVITPISTGASNDEFRIDVTVTWSDVSQQQHSVLIREDLFNWQ